MDNLEIVTIKYYRLYGCSFSTGDRSLGIKAYFTSSKEANKICRLPIGYYRSKGSVIKEDIRFGMDIPTYYDTALDWAKENLTFNEFEKNKNIFL